MRVDGDWVPLRGKCSIEFGPSGANKDEEHDELGKPGPALVKVEDLHAKGGHKPANEGDDNDADDYGDAAGGDSGEDLATDDAVDYAVAEEEDDLGKGVTCLGLLFSLRV